MWLRRAFGTTLLVLGAGLVAGQVPDAPRDLTFEARDLAFEGRDLTFERHDLTLETLDLVFRTEDIGEQVRKTAPPTTPAPAPPPAKQAPAPPAVVGTTKPPPPAPVVGSPQAPAKPLGRRVALVIGNAAYKVGPLQNPGNDAAAVAELLEKKLGFDKVILGRDLGFDSFRAALRQFAREATGAQIGVVFFAGHGVEINGRNYLIPVDARLARAGDVELEAVALETVLEQLSVVTTLKLVILDACRNNVFAMANARRSVGRGLARIEPEGHSVVVYAAKHGTTAADGRGRHSPFTEVLLKHLASGQEIRFLFGNVRDGVMAATGGVQEPHVYSNLGGGRIYLGP